MKRGQVAFLTGTHVVNDLYQGAVPALLPFLMSERGYSYSAVAGITLAATGLSSLTQPIFGMIVDRRQRNWLIPAGFLVAAAGIACAAMSSGYLLTWVCVAIAGIGISAYHPPATNAARAAGGPSQFAMSAFSVGGTVGASLAPPLVTLVVGGLGLSGGYLLAVPAIVVGLLWTLQKPWYRYRGYVMAAPIAATAEQRRGHDDWPAFGRLVLVTVCWSVPYVITMSMASPFLIHTLGSSKSVAALTLSLFTVAGAVGTLVGGALADRYGRRIAIRAGYLMAPPALLVLTLAQSTVWAALAIALVGLAMFLPFAPQVTLAQDYLPTRPGSASGVTLGLAMSVGGLASPLFGILADHVGPRGAIATAAAVLVVSTIAAFTLRDRVPPATVSEHERELLVAAER
ncbi:MFS transporter [Nocardia panacis]|uniref:MFS transporter n=1 Tax=Nocardia panacis TaxID=2340916 RepID=A0A3A4K342_9NOCA|nr:MFS transporter [Nocardia panacis]RJO70904.1 MFS transporter [Nocardia panacis]